MKLHEKKADKIIAVSQSVMRMLPSHINVEVIPNELPVEERYPEKLPTNTVRQISFQYRHPLQPHIERPTETLELSISEIEGKFLDPEEVKREFDFLPSSIN